MAITTLDGVIAGMQSGQFYAKALTGAVAPGRPHSTFYQTGFPGPGTAPASGIAGAALVGPLAGCIPFASNPAVKKYLARFQGVASGQPGLLLLCDRLWANSALNLTAITAQTINSVAFPARDNAGTVNGDGVLIGLEITTLTGAGAPVLTMGYTNEAGTAGRSAVSVDAALASSVAGSFYRMGLQAGDKGVRSIQTFTLSATWTSGAASLVAYRPLAAVEITNDGRPGVVDALTAGFPEMFDNSCLWPIFLPSSAGSSTLTGQFVQTNG